MWSEGIHLAVLDRVEDDIAVLLVGTQEIEVALAKHELPDGLREGMALRLAVRQGRIAEITADRSATAQLEAHITRKMNQLRARMQRPT